MDEAHTVKPKQNFPDIGEVLFYMKKILVTGGAGFIGSHITDRLIKDGHSVIVLDNLTTGFKEQVNSKAKFIKSDIKNLEEIAPHFTGVDYVFHLAARARIQPSIQDPAPTFHDNIIGTFNVLLASRDAGVKRVVYSASSSSYGDQDSFPLHEEMQSKFKSPYSLSKYVGEKTCELFSKLYGLETVSLRYFNVYGPRQLTSGAYATVVGIFLKQLSENKPLTIVSPGTIRRDFTHVSDIVEANILAMQSKKVGNGELINIGRGKNYSINEVASLILAKSKPEVRLAGADFLTQPHAVYVPERPGEAKITLADNKKAQDLLGWKPKINFETGIMQLFEKA